MLFNCHTHSAHSHDAQAAIADLCETALKEGMAGFAVTDHCDCECADDPNAFSSLMDSYEDCRFYKKQYEDRLVIACGVEIGEALYDPSFAAKVIGARPWDVVLGSVHAVRFPGWEMPFSLIDFTAFSDEFIRSYLHVYFDDLKEMALTQDFDVLCHLTVPLRYICGKYGRRVDIEEYDGKIDEILKIVVDRDKTLEINTSGCTAERSLFMPDEAILDRYLAMGGSSLTVGSDAHTADRLANGLKQAQVMLKNRGITQLTYYLNRSPLSYSIE